MNDIDPRIIRVGIEIDGQLRTYEGSSTGFYITASGQKFANPNQGECNVAIANLPREVRDFIATETSPFNRNRVRKRLTLEVGRRSYGTSVVYQGDIFRSNPGERPDNILTIRCLTGQFNKGQLVEHVGQEMESLSSIAQRVASDNELNLQFDVPDKQIANYSFSGPALNQVEKLRELSGADVFIDGDSLVLKGTNQPLPGDAFLVNSAAGLKVPQLTEQGVKAEFLFDPRVKIGSQIQIESEQYPAANGRYVIYKLAYNLATREAQFHYTAEARRA